MTIRDKLSMFFESLLEQVEGIDNEEIKEKALKGLMTQLEFHLMEVEQVALNINKTKGNNNGI